MLPYILIFTYLSILVFLSLPSVVAGRSMVVGRFPFVTAALLFCFVAFRDETGGDWWAYAAKAFDAKTMPFHEAAFLTDPGYSVLNWVSGRLFGTQHFVNAVCAFILIGGLSSFARCVGCSPLVFVFSFPYVIIVIGMGYTRQSAALGLLLYGLVSGLKGFGGRYIFFAVLATLFHKSAILMSVMGLLVISKNKIFSLLVGGASLCLTAALLVLESVESLSERYIESDYQASGAWVRVSMVVMSAGVYLHLREKIPNMGVSAKRIWDGFSVSAFVLPIALYASPSSVAVDRISLYWYPLQIMVWSSLPFSFNGKFPRFFAFAGAFVYSLLVFLTWMLWSPNATEWLPYKSVLPAWINSII
jgi:hypothetical protein